MRRGAPPAAAEPAAPMAAAEPPAPVPPRASGGAAGGAVGGAAGGTPAARPERTAAGATAPDERPCCRICMGDEGALFIPCQCTGSMAYVHPECLAEWRRTAANSRAFYACEQCGTEYKIRQNALALALMSRNFVIGLTVVICVVLTLSVGIVVDTLPLPKTSTECAHALYRLIAYAPPWYTSARVSLSWRERCDVFVLGACAVATVGFGFYLRAEWMRHRDGGAEGMRHMAMFVAWLTSLQSAQSSRFGVAFGLLFAYR